MKWFATLVLVIACSGIGYCAVLGADDEQTCGDVKCTEANSYSFKEILKDKTVESNKYVCISFNTDVTDLFTTTTTTTTTTSSISSPPTTSPTNVNDGVGTVNLNFNEQCASKYKDDKDLCTLLTSALKEGTIKDCDVYDANGAYQFSASLPVAALLFVCLHLLQ